MGLLTWLYFGASVPCTIRNALLCPFLRPLSLLQSLLNCCCCGLCCLCPSVNRCYGGYEAVAPSPPSNKV